MSSVPIPTSVDNEIDKIEQFDRSNWDCEVDFIDQVVEWVDDDIRSNGMHWFDFKCKYMHQSPKVQFSGPDPRNTSWSKEKAGWIDKKSCEFADLLFLVNIYDDTGITDRRACISQSKFSKENSSNQFKWSIKMHQYYLLSEMPTFRFEKSREDFDINRENKSLTTYSFASDFDECFFSTVSEMPDIMPSTKDVKTGTYNVSGSESPYPYQCMRGTLKRMIQSRYGQSFTDSDRIYDMLVEMFDKYDFDDDRSPDMISDGGSQIDTGMAVVQIEKYVGDDEQYEFEEFENKLRI